MDSPAIPQKWTEKLNKLDINENIAIEEEVINTVKCAVSRLHKKMDKRFSIRKIKATNEIRVWRLL